MRGRSGLSSVHAHRSLAGSRPLYVRGHRDTAPYSATRCNTAGQRKTDRQCCGGVLSGGQDAGGLRACHLVEAAPPAEGWPSSVVLVPDMLAANKH